MKKIRNGSQVFWRNGLGESGIIIWDSDIQKTYRPILVKFNNVFWKDLPSVTLQATDFDKDREKYLLFVCEEKCLVRVKKQKVIA